MDKITLRLLPKQLKFLERALKAQIEEYEIKLQTGNCTEDEASDINNDLILMRPTLKDLQEAIKR